MGDPYDALALIYDRWQDRFGRFSDLVLPRLLPALRRHAAERASCGRPVMSFVDVGCGTGTLLLALASSQPDWRLAGTDACTGMLECARNKPGASGIVWQQAEMGAPLPAGPHAAAGSFFNALNNLPDTTALHRAFLAIAAALEPGGRFIFDVNNRAGYSSWWEGRDDYRGDGWRFSLECEFDPSSARAHGRAVVCVGERREELQLHERCFDDDEIEIALLAAELAPSVREPWAPYDTGEPGKTWWEARRL